MADEKPGMVYAGPIAGWIATSTPRERRIERYVSRLVGQIDSAATGSLKLADHEYDAFLESITYLVGCRRAARKAGT